MGLGKPQCRHINGALPLFLEAVVGSYLWSELTRPIRVGLHGGRILVGGRRHTLDEIMENLQWAQRALAGGRSARAVCRDLDITEQTYYRWRKEYGSSRVDLMKRIQRLEKENARLRRLVAEQALQRSI
jgi:putative transposase